MIKALRNIVFAGALLAISGVSAFAACSGTPGGNFICASPDNAAGPINPRALVNRDLPSGIDAAKIGGGSVSTTEYNLLDGITSFGQSVIQTANAGALRTLISLVIGTNVQAWDTDLDSWAAVVRASGIDTWIATPSSANLASALTDETGSGAAVFATAPQISTIELGNATDTTLSRSSAGILAVEGVTIPRNTTSDTLTIGSIELGAASDTTLARSGAGAITVEGVGVALNSTSLAHTASQIELGNASDTTLTRSSAGVLAVEGTTVSLNSTSATHTAGTIELGAATDTTLARSSAGVATIEGATLMRGSQNLADVSSASTSATNLGLGTGNTPQFAGVEIGNASDTTLARASAGVASIEGSNILLASGIGKTALWIPASEWQPTITNGAGISVLEIPTNDLMQTTLDFDTNTQQFATWMGVLPGRWDLGTITYQVYARMPNATSTQTVQWGLSCVAISNDDAIDTAPGTVVTKDDTFLATGDLHVSDESSAVTVAGTPASGDLIICKLQRNVASDNATGDVSVIGVRIYYTANALKD